MTTEELLRRVYGQLLQLGAWLNSSELCRFAFGRANSADNARALRFAAERRSYNVFYFMLTAAAQNPSDSRFSFRTGHDWYRAQHLALNDRYMETALSDYKARSGFGGGVAVRQAV